MVQGNMLKKLFFLGIVTSSVWLGVGQAKALADEPRTDTLNFVNYRDVRDLNPHLYAGEMYAQEMLFESLVDITPTGYKPCLAESWDISPDGRVYTFKIRRGVTFTDGTPCDAYAVKANFDAIIENRKRHTWLEMMRLLEKVIELLANQKPLPEKNRDHQLSGDYAGCRECHITPDWLLIYEVADEELILYLTRTGSHSDLF